MSKKITYLLGILLTILIGTFLYWWLCCNCCKSETCEHKKGQETIEVEPIQETSFNPFSVSDDDLEIEVNENFNFKESNFGYIVPLSDNVKNAVLKLKSHLDDNPSKQINVTGFYTASEENNSAYPNLGLARANAVKNYFTSNGISSKSINTFGELNNELIADTNKVHFGPVDFGIKTIEEGDNSEAESLKELGDLIRANPLILYFNTGEAAISLSDEQRQKLANISKYIDKVDGATCKVVGHTDNTGDAAINMTLGQERADFAKNYLISNSIPESRISTSSEGPNEPIADNDTEEGKAKNRRTVVTIN